MINKLIHDSENILLVQPDFPIPSKSRNHHDFLPIGLLKIASYLRPKNKNIRLVHYKQNQLENTEFDVDLIFVTSIFTYWSKYVKDTVLHYKKYYPTAKIVVGGGYATLLPNHCKDYTQADYVYTGVFHEVEKCIPAYDLIDTDYQIIHTTRGCIRNCDFCGVYKIEPIFTYKKSIKKEIIKKKVIFYDNNFLANPYVENILRELIKLRKTKKITYLESQSGFDGRLLEKKPYLAKLIHDAGFKNVRIAWDHTLEDAPHIHKQIKLLKDAGYSSQSISVFMIYNNKIPYYVLEQKRAKCFEYGVQVMDCRNRPLDITSDGYNPHKKSQTREDYFIHEHWTDKQVRQFRRNVRRHNIAIRFRTDWYSKTVERKKLDKKEKKELFKLSYEEVKPLLQDAWNPKEPYLMEDNKWEKKKT